MCWWFWHLTALLSISIISAQSHRALLSTTFCFQIYLCLICSSTPSFIHLSRVTLASPGFSAFLVLMAREWVLVALRVNAYWDCIIFLSIGQNDEIKIDIIFEVLQAYLPNHFYKSKVVQAALYCIGSNLGAQTSYTPTSLLFWIRLKCRRQISFYLNPARTQYEPLGQWIKTVAPNFIPSILELVYHF